jgi:hypothetical protein
MDDLLEREKDLLLTRHHARGAGQMSSVDDAIFKLELYDYNKWRSHGHLGTVNIPVKSLRQMGIEGLPPPNGPSFLFAKVR